MSKEEVPSVNPKLDAMGEMLKTIHDLNERNKMLEAQIEKVKHYLDYDIPHDLINEATTKIWRMLK